MGRVSKREDDEKLLTELGDDVASFSPMPIDPNDLEATRLKIEVENVRRYQYVVEYALRKARSQIDELQRENAQLRERIASATDAPPFHQQRREEDISRLLAEKDQELKSVISKLREYEFKNLDELYRQAGQPSLAAKFGDSQGADSALLNGRQTGDKSHTFNPVIPSDLPIQKQT